MTPLDVVKIRLQAQQKDFVRNKCFLYCNGLMEHICYCNNGNNGSNGNNAINGKTIGKSCHSYHSISVATFPQNNVNDRWFRRPGHFNGTLVCIYDILVFI